MPHVVRKPITVKVGKELRRFNYSDIITDEDVASLNLLKTHAHALNRVEHSSIVCKATCAHYTHPWNKSAAEAPTTGRKTEALK